jgi:hypothetical protein
VVQGSPPTGGRDGSRSNGVVEERAPRSSCRRRSLSTASAREGPDRLVAPAAGTQANNRSVAENQSNSRACRLARPFERAACRIRRGRKPGRHRTAMHLSSQVAASLLVWPCLSLHADTTWCREPSSL